MGSCLGHYPFVKESFNFYKYFSKARESVKINTLDKSESEEHIMIELDSLHNRDKQSLSKFDISQRESSCFCLERLKSVFTINKNHCVESSSLKLGLVGDDYSVSEEEGGTSKNNYETLVPSLATFKESGKYISTSIHSLDLEWEHLPEMVVHSLNVDKEEPKSMSAEVWSKISDSADSLEWDLAEVEMKEEIDTETEQLLQEIETLSSKTLQETQKWVS